MQIAEPEVDDFGDTELVSGSDESNGVIANTVASFLCRFEKPLQLALGEVILQPFVGVGRLGPAIWLFIAALLGA
jgi:hypothetical protein